MTTITTLPPLLVVAPFSVSSSSGRLSPCNNNNNSYFVAFGINKSSKQQQLPLFVSSLFQINNSSLPAAVNHRNLSVHAHQLQHPHNNSGRNAADFAAGLLLGSAVFGTLAYLFAPQIRRSLLNEDEYGFKKAKRPMYYDEGLEKTRQTLNRKIGQLNSTIDNISTRLRGRKDSAQVPVETDHAEEATL